MTQGGEQCITIIEKNENDLFFPDLEREIQISFCRCFLVERIRIGPRSLHATQSSFVGQRRFFEAHLAFAASGLILGCVLSEMLLGPIIRTSVLSWLSLRKLYNIHSSVAVKQFCKVESLLRSFRVAMIKRHLK